jgi:hypothetical protein
MNSCARSRPDDDLQRYSCVYYFGGFTESKAQEVKITEMPKTTDILKVEITGVPEVQKVQIIQSGGK